MGLFDFLDARRGIARWADKCFREAKPGMAGASDQDIAHFCLAMRYRSLASDALKLYISGNAAEVRTIHHLCYLIADAECFGCVDSMRRMQTYGEIQEAYRIIDEELEKLGYREDS